MIVARKVVIPYLCLCLATAGLRADQYWFAGDGVSLGGSGSWDTSSSNWRQGSDTGSFSVWPNGGNDGAVFVGTAGRVALNAAIRATNLTFASSTGWIVTNGTLNVGSAGSIVLTNSATATVYSDLAGSGVLTLSSYGNNWPGRVEGLSLLGSNSAFSGKIVVQRLAGNYYGLSITNDINLGAVPASYVADALTVNGAFVQAGNSDVVTVPVNRGITLGSGGATFAYGVGFAISSRITGLGGVGLRNTAVTFSSVSNDFNGALSLNGGVVKAGADNVLPHGAGKGNLFFGDWDGVSTVDLNGHELTLNGISGNKCLPNSRFNNSASGAATLVIGDNDVTGPIEFCGMVTNSGGPLSLTKIGAGTQTLTGTNSHSGATTVNNGRLVLAASAVSSNSTFVINNANGLVFSNQSSAVLGGLGGTGLFIMVNSSSSTLDLTIGCNNSASCFSGVLSGPGRLAKVGTGTWILNGSAVHSGGLVVSNGFLGGTGVVSGTVNVYEGAGLSPGSNGVGTLTIGSLAVNGSSIYDWDYGLPVSDLVLVTNQLTFASGSTNTIRLFNPGHLAPPSSVALFTWSAEVPAPSLAGVTWVVERVSGSGAEVWPQPDVVLDAANRRIYLRLIRGTVIMIR